MKHKEINGTVLHHQRPDSLIEPRLQTATGGATFASEALLHRKKYAVLLCFTDLSTMPQVACPTICMQSEADIPVLKNDVER